MTQANTARFSEFLVKVEDPANAGTYIAPCGLTSRGFSQSATTKETVIPDCDNEDAAVYTGRDTDALSSSITGSGVLDRVAFATWRTLLGESVNYRVQVVGAAAVGGGYYQGKFILTKFDLKGERGQRVTVDVTMDSDGAWAWTPASS